MSRSEPQGSPNPALHWLEWSADLKADAHLRYYDKAAQHNVAVALPFSFCVLDELASVRGWSDLHQSGIFSNEVRSSANEPLVVRAFGDPKPLARGLYKDIRADVQAAGGRYHASIYLYADAGGDVGIHNLKLRGAALSAWLEFRRGARGKLYESAVRLSLGAEGKKGSVRYIVPAFALEPMADGEAVAAVSADRELQAYLREYFARDPQAREPGNATAQGAPAEGHRAVAQLAALAGKDAPATASAPATDEEFEDDIPF